MDKKTIRKNILEIRNSLENKLEKEKKINKYLRSFNFSSSDIIAGYFPTKSEVNILPFIESLSTNITCMPFIEKTNHHLLFKSWRKDDKVIKGKFDINTPLDGTFVEPNKILVPLVAFDRVKNRLGYGGGFYDRTISYLEMIHSITTIGIAFSEQEIKNIPVMQFDKKLDYIVTQKEILK